MTSLSSRLGQAGDAQDGHDAQDAQVPQDVQGDAAVVATEAEQPGEIAGIVPTGDAVKPAGLFELSIIVPTFK